MTAVLSGLNAVTKVKYDQPKVFWESFNKNPAFASVRKNTANGGQYKNVAVQTEAPIGGGPTVAAAITNMNPGQYNAFLCPRITDYGVCRVSGSVFRGASKSADSLLDVASREIDGIILNNTRSVSINMFRTGTGSRGQISASSSVGTATITLANISDITNFCFGQQLEASQTDGGTTKSGFVTVTKINRVLGTMTVASTWTTGIPALAAGDFLYRRFDCPNGGNNLMVTGAQAWIPPAASRPVASTPFFNVNRQQDEVRLAGTYLDGTGQQMQEIVIEAIAAASVEGATIDKIWMHPRDRANFVKELGTHVTYVKDPVSIPNSKASIGFQAIEFSVDGETVQVMEDLTVPRYTCLVTQWDTWALESAGPAIQICKENGLTWNTVSGDDSYELRTVFDGQLTNAAPAYSVLISNIGL